MMRNNRWLVWLILACGLSLAFGLSSIASTTAGSINRVKVRNKSWKGGIFRKSGVRRPDRPIYRAEDHLLMAPDFPVETRSAGIALDTLILSSNDDPTSKQPTTLLTPTVSIGNLAFPGPGLVIDVNISIPILSSDGEDVDSLLFYGPKGWEILSISAAPAANNPGCGTAVTEMFDNPDQRGVAYWGIPGATLSALPPTLPPRSNCGPYASNTTQNLSVKVTLRVDPDAAICPGAPKFVGIPNDSLGFTTTPVLNNSMTSYLRGDGNSLNPSTIKMNFRVACPSPEVTLDKLVSSRIEDCPTGGTDSLQVLPGTQVYYCYLMLNNSVQNNVKSVTTTFQTIEDDFLGTILDDLQLTLPALEGDYYEESFTVTASPGTCITNTATWTSTTEIGFGQDPQTDILAPFSNTQYTATSSDSATVCVAWGSHMPLVFGSKAP